MKYLLQCETWIRAQTLTNTCTLNSSLSSALNSRDSILWKQGRRNREGRGRLPPKILADTPYFNQGGKLLLDPPPSGIFKPSYGSAGMKWKVSQLINADSLKKLRSRRQKCKMQYGTLGNNWKLWIQFKTTFSSSFLKVCSLILTTNFFIPLKQICYISSIFM